MTRALAPIAALLIATSFLLIGNGLQGTLVAVRANLETFPIALIGLLMSAYYVGFVAGCFVNPKLVARVGHIRTYAALAAVASAAALLHVLWVTPIIWIVLRVVVGFCFAGLSMVSESWINESATNENRGRILSVYRVVDLTSVTIGQVLLMFADPAGFALFCLVSVLISIALVPVALTTSMAPRPIKAATFRMTKVIETSPLAAWGACAAGLSNGAFWGLGPVFVQNAGYGLEAVSAFMTSVIIGGALLQYPLGWLSDKFDRRFVLITIAFLGAVLSLGLAYSTTLSLTLLLCAAFLYGAFAMSHYSMAVAHANDFATEDDFVEVSSGLLFLFGCGAAVGPFIASLAIGFMGNVALFLYTALVQFTLTAYGLYRFSQRSGVPPEEQAEFVAITRSTQEIFELDPRSPPDLSSTHDKK